MPTGTEPKKQSHSLVINRQEQGQLDKRSIIQSEVGAIASTLYIDELDIKRVDSLIKREGFEIIAEHVPYPKEGSYSYGEGIYRTSIGVFIIKHRQEHVDIEIYYNANDKDAALIVAKKFNACRPRKGERPSIGFLSISDGGEQEFNDFKIEKTSLDIELLYGAEFVPKYNQLMKRLKAPKAHGLVVLHGEPGTGKTMLIRHLISKITTKRFLFIPIDMVDKLTGPQLMMLLNSRPNSILVIEEAESLLRSRLETQGRAAVANLLNITDGLLRDFLHFQAICTFNCDLKEIDQALLRKGRLIAEHKFEPLPIEQAKLVAERYKLPIPKEGPKTLAELFDSSPEFGNSFRTTRQMGFRLK